ncbi:hypothetical protein Y88_1441 [Novosphingobium nitrogenifigens DSM 19370]|uniref:Uncharacterized protein n=1 Tax=Novosphingobium nitrogenifigens DSM 19370 TaxID=983920 RepID=F1ZCS4_9SPHN|nr:hypothetical protein Y88_1441 [Novosphingobium nitrogenifigens DSM 19370]
MATTSNHYRACAEKSLRDAEVSSLANVRERHLHSAKAWQTMAERAARVEQARQQQQDMTSLAPVQKTQDDQGTNS